MTPPLPPMTDAMPLIDDQLADVRALATAATDGIELYLKWDGSIVECGVGGRYCPTEHDVALFVRSKSIVEALLAEIERLRAEQLRADCDALTMPAALAEIDRLTRERDEARAEWAKQENLKTVYRDGVQQATREIDRLRDENAELRATASLFAERIDTEIAASRARWLTAEERETLRWIRDEIVGQCRERALAVLDKLLKETT